MRLPVALVLVALVSAGCATPGAPAGDPNGTDATADAGVAPSAPNDDGARPAAAVDTGHMPHLHDYWMGKERVTLFEGDLEPDALNLTFATFVQVVLLQEAVVGGMQFFLPDGAIVYEGTGQMEVTASWSDPRITGIGFVYRSAEQHAESFDFHEGGALPNGEPFSIDVAPIQTDMPHAKTSRWWFAFGPDESPGALAGPFHLKIDIVRVNDIMTFPAHPDFWQGEHELLLLETDHHGEVPSYPKRATQPLTQGNFTEDLVKFDHPVPMESKAIRVNATITQASSTPGEVASFGFFYHGADRRALFRCTVKDIGSLPFELSWVVPVSMEQTDSPYAEGSMWEFLVEPHVVLADGTPQMGGMTDVSYDYHVVATALDASPEEMDKCAVDDA